MIYDITPFSLLDFADKLSCIIWLSGCNMRCKYCYNEHIIKNKGRINTQTYENFLQSRAGLLDGVVFSGGECTQNADLKKYVKFAKNLGFATKIDSNGSNPALIQELIDENLVDFFAIDFKAMKEKFFQITNSNCFFEFEKTLEILLKNNADFEVRTTWHFDLLTLDDILKMNEFLRKKGYKNKYYLQKFLEVENIAKLKQSKKIINLDSLNDDFELRNF